MLEVLDVENGADRAAGFLDKIPEFKENDNDSIPNTDDIRSRLSGPDTDPAIFIMHGDGQDVGCLIAERDQRVQDRREMYYAWMAAVIPEFRKGGVMRELWYTFEVRARQLGYKKVTVKTRNSRPDMIRFLVKSGCMIEDVEERENVRDNRILLGKVLEV